MKKKNMDFLQAFNSSNISLFGDADKDKVPNVFDCRPFDKEQDGLFGRAINVLSRGKYGQSKEEYELEKLGKIERTHFERDRSGKVIRVTRNGQELEPEAKSVDQLLREYRQKQAEETYNKLLEKEKLETAKIKKQIELQKLKIQKQKLAEKQRLESLLNLQPSASQQVVSSIFGVYPQRQIPLQREGYYIEHAPTLPKGYRWKKIPKSKKKQSKAELVNVCPRCNIPMVLRPNMLGRLVWQCPRCGGIH